MKLNTEIDLRFESNFCFLDNIIVMRLELQIDFFIIYDVFQSNTHADTITS